LNDADLVLIDGITERTNILGLEKAKVYDYTGGQLLEQAAGRLHDA
jgi:hypothetical protein